MFNSYVKLPEGNSFIVQSFPVIHQARAPSYPSSSQETPGESALRPCSAAARHGTPPTRRQRSLCRAAP